MPRPIRAEMWFGSAGNRLAIPKYAPVPLIAEQHTAELAKSIAFLSGPST
jgi:hypothetical protein